MKNDLRKDIHTMRNLRWRAEEPVKEEDGHAMAETIGAYAYVECSAIWKIGVRDVFETVIRALSNTSPPLLMSSDDSDEYLHPVILPPISTNEESVAQELDNNPSPSLHPTRNETKDLMRNLL